MRNEAVLSVSFFSLFSVLLQIEVRISEDKDLETANKRQICEDLRKFLTPIREKLSNFEQDLKDR